MPLFPGIESYTHKDNGMTFADMAAALNVARARNEVIMFRSTGYWSRRWIARGHPTKPFHVKGKSSDWGPMAGFVPSKAIFTKVGSDPLQCADGELLNGEAIEGKYAARTPLILSAQELKMQTTPDNAPGGLGRCPVKEVLPNQVGTKDVWLLCERTDLQDKNKKVPFVFVARWDAQREVGPAAAGKYTIFSLDERYGTWAKSQEVVSAAGHKFPKAKALQQFIAHHAEVVYVMRSAEEHEGQQSMLPLTGDYDLFAVGPHYSDYGPDDKRLDMTLNDRALEERIKKYYLRLNSPLIAKDHKAWDALVKQLGFIEAAPHGEEDHDKGNISPRILNVINSLNYEMARMRELAKSAKLPREPARWLASENPPPLGDAKLVTTMRGFGSYWMNGQIIASNGVMAEKKRLFDAHYLFRRVHHNQEAMRPFLKDKKNSQGQVEALLATFPLTTFQPKLLPAPYNHHVMTFESYDDLKPYYLACYQAGYVMPKNPVWGFPSNLRDLIRRNEAR